MLNLCDSQLCHDFLMTPKAQAIKENYKSDFVKKLVL